MFNSSSLLRKAVVSSLSSLLLAGVYIPSAIAQQPSQLPAGGASTLPLSNTKSPNTSTSTTGTLTAIPEDFADLRLAPGFLLDVQVYDEPEMSSQARVDKEGNVTVPLIGTVHVAGMTVSAAEKTFQDKLREGEILKDPQVTVNVEQYASSNVTVLGEVQNPGRIQLLAPHSLLDIIGLSGGETNLAGNTIEVRNPGPNGISNHTYHYSRSSNGESIRDVIIQPGDTVTVARAGIVYVLGAVNRPGGYVMQEDGKLNVAQALSLAEGTSLAAKIGALRVVRHTPDGQVQDIPISYKGIMEGKVTPLTLQAEDIVYVPVSKLKAAFTTSSSLIGQTSSALIFAAP